MLLPTLLCLMISFSMIQGDYKNDCDIEPNKVEKCLVSLCKNHLNREGIKSPYKKSDTNTDKISLIMNLLKLAEKSALDEAQSISDQKRPYEYYRYIRNSE